MKKIVVTGLLFVLITSSQFGQKVAKDGFIYTVNGKVEVDSINFALTHEHVMSNFMADPNYVGEYDTAALFRQVVPYLKNLKSQGVHSIFECTAMYFGRNVELLKAISDSTGIQMISNTGFYGAFNDFYVPDFAFKANVTEIAGIWISEFENGIDHTGIKPGFIKLAFDDGEPSEMDIKLFKAGVLTHRKTGMTMVVHTGANRKAGIEQLRILDEMGVAPDAWIWVHANKLEDIDVLIDAAKSGAWISLDGVNESNISEYIPKINFFRDRGLLNKLLLSHDGNSYPGGKAIRGYHAITTFLIPELKNHGYTDGEIDQLMVTNPKEAFRIRVRTNK